MSFFAKKSLGQNFLNSVTVAEKIVVASEVTENDIVLEIGPGKGMLTQLLLKKAGRVIAIEKDHRAIPVLEEMFADEKKLELIEADILEWEPEKYGLKNGEYAVVANIPYYITGEIMRKFLSGKVQPKSMTLMVQKEVADRIIARDNKQSLLSLSVKCFGEPKYIMTVKPGSFTPAPSIDSAVLHIKNISRDYFDSETFEKLFFDVIHAGFAHKRKRLLANIAGALNSQTKKPIATKEKIESVAKEIGIDTNARAEDLTLDVWKTLVRKLLLD